MPWKESDLVSERMRFVVRLELGERMSDLCREFGISRKTGYKIWNRFSQAGPAGLQDRSRVPEHIPHKTSEVVRREIISFKKCHPSWGPRKLKKVLEKQNPGVCFPAASTIGDILVEAGMVKKRRRRRGTPRYPDRLRQSTAPNDIWCTDYKGQFRLGNREYCYPLTTTDHFSRYALCCEALSSTELHGARTIFETIFGEYGLPKLIRSDNGAPFASCGLFGLTRLSVWWLKLGIVPERIEPGAPQENGRHERFHLTLKEAATRPAKENFLQQQECFDHFLREYNDERPHEALDMEAPASIYSASRRKVKDLDPELDYPLHDTVRQINGGGQINIKRRNIYVSTALAGEKVGLREIDGGWLLSFARVDLGRLENKSNRFIAHEVPDFSAVLRDETVSEGETT